MAEVVDADVEVDSGGPDGGQPDAGAEGVPRDRGAVAGEQQSVRTQASESIRSASWSRTLSVEETVVEVSIKNCPPDADQALPQGQRTPHHGPPS